MITGAPAGQGGIDEELGKFGANAVTVRLIGALLGAIPDEDALEAWGDTKGCCAHHGASGLVDEIRPLWSKNEVGRVLFAARSLDTGDTGITVVTGIRTALSLFMKDGGPGAGADAQQQADAALKALGLSFIVASLFPGTPQERVRALAHMPTGRALLTTYAAVEIALPLGQQVQPRTVRRLCEERGKQIAGKLMSVVGRAGLDEAQATLDALIEVLDNKVEAVAPHTERLADTLKSVIPNVIHGKGQTLADMIAAGADALPIYRFLCARLAAESQVLQVVWRHEPDRAPADASPPVEPQPTATESGPPPVPAGLAEAAAGPPPLPSSLQAQTASPAEDGSPATPAGEHDLSGIWLHAGPTGELWLYFNRQGMFSNAPPTQAVPDWVAHADQGHFVGTYQRIDDELHIHWPSGFETRASIQRDTYQIKVGDWVFRRVDYALTGMHLDGTWTERGGAGVVHFRSDGTFTHPDGYGRYALGTGAVALRFSDGHQINPSLLSDLDPEATCPNTIWLSGRPWDRVD